MERLTKQQMVAEFGDTGVENPMIMDLITTDAASEAVVLVMIERRPWGAHPRQFAQIEEKINRYLGYVIDGFLAEQYPQYEGRKVLLRLDCVQTPHGDAIRFVKAAEHAIGAAGMAFVVNVLPDPAAPK